MTLADGQAGMVSRWRDRRSRLWYEAVEPRLMILRQLPMGGAPLLAALLGVNLALGLLPVAFVVAASVVVGHVPDVLGSGVGSAAWDDLVTVFLVAAGLFVLQQALAPVQLCLGELVKRRVDGGVHDRIMVAALRSPGIGPMEDQQALDALQQADRGLARNYETPGMACAGMLALVARYTRLAGFAGLVAAVVSVPAGVALAVATLVFRYGNRGGLRRYAQVGASISSIYRHANYLRSLALRPQAGKELRVFGLVDWLAGRYEARHRDWLDPQARARRAIYVWPYLRYTALGVIVAVAAFVLIASSALAAALSLTELAIALQSSVAALMLGDQYPEADEATQKGMLAIRGLDTFERVTARYDQAPRVVATDRLHQVSPADLDPPTVRFEGTTFKYPGSDRTVCKDLHLELPAGRSTAIVGVNGAGKTTLVKLLTRLYEPTGGRITFAGVDIDHLPVQAWRRQISVVFQDFVRYEMSVADNIALGAPYLPVDLERVRRAAHQANLLEAVERLPGGFDTPLSRAYEGGTDLSGGQWQRVAIARSLYALAAGARVLVLDEPTSALDVRVEAEFFEHFVDITENVTSLIISHRFSSVRRADSIAVLEDGRVLEAGTHDHLLASGGRYAELFNLQAARFAAGLDAEGGPVEQPEPGEEGGEGRR